MKKSQLFLIGLVIFGFELSASASSSTASEDVYALDQNGNYVLKPKSSNDRIEEAIFTNNEHLLQASLQGQVKVGKSLVNLARESGRSQTMIESLQEKQTGLSPFISGLFARSEKSVSPEQAQVTRVSPGSPLSLLSRLSPAYTVIHPEASAQTFYGSSCQDSDSEGV